MKMKESNIVIPRRNGKVLHAILFESEKILKENERPIVNSPITKSPIVILCHGFPGDRSENNRFLKLSRALNEKSIDAITFDFAGYGENEREPISIYLQIENLEDLVKWVKEKGYNSIGVLGLSIGGLTALLSNPILNNYLERKATVFWAPAFYASRILNKSFRPFIKIIFKNDSRIIKIPDHEWEKVIIKKQFIEEIYSFNPTKIDDYLKSFTNPALILQGTTDPMVRARYTKEAFQNMPQDEHHKIIYIKGAGHNFGGQKLEQFIDNSINWFEKYLK
jgi:esterase/lipase